MINLIKYLPLSLRNLTGPRSVKGPTFSRSREVQLKADGSLISFKAPQHNPFVPYGPEKVNPLGSLDQVLDRGGLRRYEKNAMPCQSWAWATHVLRSWGYWGSWFTGCRIAVTMEVTIVGRDSDHPLPDVSFLNPRAFEGALADYLNSLYGREKEGTVKPRYHGPVDWKPHTKLTVPAATFKLYKVGLQERLHSPSTFLFFPISSKYFIKMEFTIRKRVSAIENSEWIDASEAENLINQVIDSVRLIPNAQAVAELKSLKKDFNELNTTREFYPLKWPA